MITNFRSVSIRRISHNDHRYPTVGDWTFDAQTGHLDIAVSDTGKWRTDMAVAYHELTEALLCLSDGVDPDDVDEFDVAFEENADSDEGSCPHDCIEPGDCPDAPYRRQHSIATIAERLLIEELGTPWAEYEQDLAGLFPHE